MTENEIYQILSKAGWKQSKHTWFVWRFDIADKTYVCHVGGFNRDQLRATISIATWCRKEGESGTIDPSVILNTDQLKEVTKRLSGEPVKIN